MYRLLLVLLLAVFESQAASVRVSVSEPINGRAEADVQFAARVKAKDEGISKLPVMMVVHEQIKDDQYFEQVESLAAGGATVAVVSERFDAASNLYHLVADVELDDELTMKLLGSIQRGQSAIRELADLRKELAGEAKSTAENLALNPTDWRRQLSGLKITPEHFIKDGVVDKQAQKRYAIELGAKVLASELSQYVDKARAKAVLDDETKVDIDSRLGKIRKTAEAKAEEDKRLASQSRYGLMPWDNPKEVGPIYAVVDVPGRYDLQVFAPLVGIIAKHTGAEASEIGQWIGAAPCLVWYKIDTSDSQLKLNHRVYLVPAFGEHERVAEKAAIESFDVSDRQYNPKDFFRPKEGIAGDKPTSLYVRFDRKMDPELFPKQVAIKACYKNTEIYQAILAIRKSEGLSRKKP